MKGKKEKRKEIHNVPHEALAVAKPVEGQVMLKLVPQKQDAQMAREAWLIDLHHAGGSRQSLGTQQCCNVVAEKEIELAGHARIGLKHLDQLRQRRFPVHALHQHPTFFQEEKKKE